MLEKKFINNGELEQYGEAFDLNSRVKLLILQQQDTWNLAGDNYAALPKVQKRYFQFGPVHVEAHHNPGRIRSSAARTDAQSIASRPCFLCEKNLPGPQKGIRFDDIFVILVNPYPIFTMHLTIAHQEHLPQAIGPFFGDMLELSRQLYGFTIFYNGPQCGASAPDHFHFQAGNKGEMPVERELEIIKSKYAKAVFNSDNLNVFAVENWLRRFLLMESLDKAVLEKTFQHLYSSLMEGFNEEPMMNVLSLFEKGKWKVLIFPRARQRSSHYFNTGDKHLLVSPAAVEMGGLLILPRHEDFIKLDDRMISEVYEEVTASHEALEKMIAIITNRLIKYGPSRI